MRGTRWLAAAPVLVFGIGIAWLLVAATPGAIGLPYRFDAARWQAAERDSQVRCRMIADLRYRIGLTGRSREEILALLGPPGDSTNGLPTLYVLCPSASDYYILELQWAQGRVASIRVRDT